MSNAERTPRWGEALIRLVAPADDVDALLDELRDEFAREISRRGERGARAWFAREVFRSLAPILARRIIVSIRKPHRHGTMQNRFEALRYDVSYAMRQLRRAPGFTLTVLLAFALGIGANATMFGIVDELLFRPPAHVRAPNEIVTLAAGTADQGFGQRMLNYPVFAAIRAHSAGFSQVAAVAEVSVPFELRKGLGLVTVSDFTYAASASRSALRPALASPSGWLRVPALKSASLIKPVPADSRRICPSKSCTSSKLPLQCRRLWPPARPRKLMVLRRPSPKPVKSQTRPS